MKPILRVAILIATYACLFSVVRTNSKTILRIETIQVDETEWGSKSNRVGTDFVKLLASIFRFSAEEKKQNPDRKVVVIADDLANEPLVDMLLSIGFVPESGVTKARRLDQNYVISL